MGLFLFFQLGLLHSNVVLLFCKTYFYRSSPDYIYCADSLTEAARAFQSPVTLFHSSNVVLCASMPLFSRSKSRNKDNTSPQNVQNPSGYPPPNGYQIPNTYQNYQNFPHYQNPSSPMPPQAPPFPVNRAPSPLPPAFPSQPPTHLQIAPYQPRDYVQQPIQPQDFMTLVPVGDTTVARQHPAVQTMIQRQSAPPPVPPRFSPPGQMATTASPPTLNGYPEPRRTSSGPSTHLTPSSPFASPSPSRYLEASPSPWAQPGQVRSPSPAVLPQRKTGPQEPPKVRKILSLGTLNMNCAGRSDQDKAFVNRSL